MRHANYLWLPFLFTIYIASGWAWLTQPDTAASATLFVINQTTDTHDANLGDGLCDTDLSVAGEQCSLRAAISEANNLTSTTTISLPVGTYTLAITGTLEDGNLTGDLDILSNISLVGAGANNTIIQAGLTAETGVDRVFHIVGAGTNVSFQQLTIQHGHLPPNLDTNDNNNDGGGLFSNVDATITLNNVIITNNLVEDLHEDGAGIANIGGGTIYLNNSIITYNRAAGGVRSSGAGLFNVFGSTMIISQTTISHNEAGGKGGGIYNNRDLSTVEIDHSAIYSNTAGNWGGGVQTGQIVTIRNSTISGNRSHNHGGGLALEGASAYAILRHTTLAHNIADADADLSGDGGGLYHEAGTLTLYNSLIANNRLGSNIDNDCYTFTNITAHHSLMTHTTGCVLIGNQTISNTNAHLKPLANYGGNTFSHALANNSPAYDAIDQGSSGCATIYTTDQRGMTRPQGAGCDIGAIEMMVLQTTIKATSSINHTLAWGPTAAFCQHHIYASTAPYTTPLTPTYTTVTSPYALTAADNWYYTVQADCNGETAVSNPVGKFNFDL